MFDVVVGMPKREKLPTFLQYLKTAKLSKGVENSTFFNIELIWLPSKFDNVTLQTHAFRYVITPEMPLYTPMVEYCENLPDDKIPQMGVTIVSLEEKTIKIVQHPKKLVEWETLGVNGVKFVG